MHLNLAEMASTTDWRHYTLPYIMERSVSKTQLEGERKSTGITCHLCEVRKIDRKSKLNDFVEGTIIIEAHCKWFAASFNREYGCVRGDWKPLSGLIREPVTSAGQGTLTSVGNFKNLWLPQPFQCMNMKAIFAVMNTTQAVVKTRPEKNSGLYVIWTRPYSFISLQFTYMIFIYLYFTGLFPKQRHDQLPVGSWAQLVERCTNIAEVKGSSPVQAWFFFWP